jgi:collagenase-like PrtC family protease
MTMRFPSTRELNQLPVAERPVRFSVACNFDPALFDELDGQPVYEVYGKLTHDFFGGGRPSFYLPQVDRPQLERTVQEAHRRGLEFNYLLNSSSMNNVEFTTRGQRELAALLDWLCEAGVDSVTVSNLFFLRLIKKRWPELKVRISAHRETDNPRKARFWEDNGADCIVVSETTVHREFGILKAMRDAVKVDLSLIVNNWCRQDCAIASNHAVLLSNASRTGAQSFPLDYCSVYCNAWRLEEPVNYVRANWIRPEDLKHYVAIGYSNFKIVERNTPTALLGMRVRAYARGRYDGNLLDLVQNYAYPRSALKKRDEDAFSLRRMAKYFLKPSEVNLLRFRDIVDWGKKLSMLYPREGDNPVYVDNRALDGFIDRFIGGFSCEDKDCEACRHCHQYAEAAVSLDPAWRQEMTAQFDQLLEALHDGSMWESYAKTLVKEARRWLGARRARAPRRPGTGGAAMPELRSRSLGGRLVGPRETPCVRPKPAGAVSVGNLGPPPESSCRPAPSEAPSSCPPARARGCSVADACVSAQTCHHVQPPSGAEA